MTPVESVFGSDWYRRADDDIQAAEILHDHRGAVNVIAFLVQQAIEKTLKGWLFDEGADVRKIHDLESLLDDAAAIDARWEEQREVCRRATAYYVLDRYPLLPGSTATHDEIEVDVTAAKAIRAMAERLSADAEEAEPGSGQI